MHRSAPALMLALALTLAVTSACTVHRLDIHQGNFLTAETVDQVEPGMTREQIRFLLGTPMVADSFRQTRWDYIYYLDSKYREDERTHLVVWFDGDLVERVEKRNPPMR